MTSPQEVEKDFYHEVGTFIDLVCQRQMSCAKIILVATKADGELSLPQQPHPDVLASIIEKARNHLSYLYGRDSELAVHLFNEVLVTSSKIASREQLYRLHTVIEAMVREVKPLPKKAIPQCWYTWLQKLRKNPSVLIEDLPEHLPDRQGPVNITVDEIKQLEKLKDLLAQTTPDLLKQGSPIVEKPFMIENQDIVGGSNSGVMQPKARGKLTTWMIYLTPVCVSFLIAGQILATKELSSELARLSLYFLTTMLIGLAIHGFIALHSFIFQRQLPPVTFKQEDAGTHIPQDLDAPIRFLREMTEILWYSALPQLTYPRNSCELKKQIITDPMHLIKALRSLLNHNPQKSFDKTKPASGRYLEDLTQKGQSSFDVFKKIYRGRQFTAAEVWDFMFQLDIACPLDENGSLAFIPSLISNEKEEEFKKRLSATEKTGSSLCIQYTFERASVGIFYKLLSNFAQAHKIGSTSGGRIELAFVQKIEKREMAIAAGVSGRVKYSSQEEEQLNFLLHEFETRVDPLDRKKSRLRLPVPVHKVITVLLSTSQQIYFNDFRVFS